MMHCESVDDEFELFRAQSYGVESVLRHKRAASVRASAKVKVTAAATQGDPEKQSPEIVPQPRSAAERKASFKSSARRRIYQQRIPEEAVAGDNQTVSGSGQCDEGLVRPLPCTGEGHSIAVDDIGLARHGADDIDVDENMSQEVCRVYRMRSFYTKSGNIVNRGDSMRLRTPTSGRAPRRTLDVAKVVPPAGDSSHVAQDTAPSKQCEEPSADKSATDTAATSRDTSRDLATCHEIGDTLRDLATLRHCDISRHVTRSGDTLRDLATLRHLARFHEILRRHQIT